LEIQVKRGTSKLVDNLVAICQANGGVIAGGYVRYMCSPHQNPAPADDIDIFCQDQNSFSAIRTQLGILPVETAVSTELSLTYSINGKKVQVIRPNSALQSFGSVENIINHFDFTINQAYLISGTRAYVAKNFSEHEMRRELVIVSTHNPTGILKRIIKYHQKGYSISGYELEKVISSYKKVLEQPFHLEDVNLDPLSLNASYEDFLHFA
jgi:hypothetical protein